MSSNNGSKFAVGAMLGVVVGLVAGILTAPKSGKETRKEKSIVVALGWTLVEAMRR